MQRQTHIIDAKDKILGRLASEIVSLLRGKGRPDFAPQNDAGDFVVVKNANQVKISGQKMAQKKYFRHSTYLGGERETPLKKLFEADPAEVFKRAVSGMLPKNKLRAQMIKRLRIEK